MISALSLPCYSEPPSWKRQAATTSVEVLTLLIVGIAASLAIYFSLSPSLYWTLGISLGVPAGGVLLNLILTSLISCKKTSAQNSCSELEALENVEHNDSPIQKTLTLDEKYQAELYPMEVDDQQIHVYGRKIKKHFRRWEKQQKGQSFNAYMQKKMTQDSELKAAIVRCRVRYLTPREREQTAVEFRDGVLYQVGLDSETEELKPLKKGEYLFVLGRNQQNIQTLYAVDIALRYKPHPPEGKMQHSSFFAGNQDPESSGVFYVDKNGRIYKKVSMHSGHYKPTEANIPVISQFLQKYIPEKYFTFPFIPHKKYEDKMLQS